MTGLINRALKNHLGRALIVAVSIVAATLHGVPANAGEKVDISSQPITTFKDAQIGELADELIWLGGLEMEASDKNFGGLSDITFLGDARHIVMVTDRGRFYSGALTYDDAGTLTGFANVERSRIKNSKGNDLPRRFAQDAESLDTVFRDGQAVAVRVGFENLTRVADFSLTNLRPGGPAREVTIPDFLAQTRTNSTLESACIAPATSPVAGSTLLIAEKISAPNGGDTAFLLGNRDRGRLTLESSGAFSPTACAFLPNGDLLVLQRAIGLLNFRMRLVRIAGENVEPGTHLVGRTILQAAGADVDNMEGLAVHKDSKGRVRITIISDDNFNSWERTILLQFALTAAN